jgi:uroporphyrinogen decarboxylase
VTASKQTKPLLAALSGQQLVRPPFWLMRQAGRYLPEYRELRGQAENFLDFCYRPKLAVEATLQPITRYGMDAAIVFSDILVIPDALGVGVSFETGHGPVVETVRDRAALKVLSLDRLDAHLAPVYETLAGVADALDEHTALIGFAGAPWTIATYMVEGGSSRDFAATKRWAFSDPDGFGALIDILVESIAQHLVNQAGAGAEVVQIFDSWAGVLPEPQFRRWCVEPVAAIVQRVKTACPDLPIIGFPRGAGAGYLGYAKATGVNAVGLDTTVPTVWAATNLQPDSVVQGNLDPLMLVVGGAAMEQAVERIRGDLSGGGHIFNLGHGVVPETPPEHVGQLASLLRAS